MISAEYIKRKNYVISNVSYRIIPQTKVLQKLRIVHTKLKIYSMKFYITTICCLTIPTKFKSVSYSSLERNIQW